MNLELLFNRTFLLLEFKTIFLGFISVFICVLVILFIFISLYSMYAAGLEANKIKWKDGITDLLSEAIFAEEEGGSPDISLATKLLLKNRHYRQCCIDEIIHTRKELSGSACTALQLLYEKLELNRDSFKKLKNGGWLLQAKGIQELSSLQQTKYVKNIFRLTTHDNEVVRNEAQCGLVNYYGFLGLRFLNVTTHPISEWQQIQLLNKLTIAKPCNTAMMARWLKSDMDSVVILALKLATFYNNLEVYDAVVNCLQHPEVKVKLRALEYLIKMQIANTADAMINAYSIDNKTFSLAIINALKTVGTIQHVPFLLQQLNDNDNEVKAAAAKALAVVHPSGNAFLQAHSFAAIAPWNQIFKQVTNELAA